ncbi:hypothetical protein OAU33_02445 [Flavobacteriaceae bacterium]|jgi:hypothetical protein|nr:hypothetical protein [Flavobacteriaceae bacterium]MDC3259797.1 hypothetical protein [Flavobacteriaceae bacterium]
MKKLLFLFTLLVGQSFFAQEGETRINMWYGTINNSDVEEHLALEKHFKSVWKQQKEAGLLANWEMWQLLNPDKASTETTYLYVKFYTEENRKKSASISGIPEGLDAETWDIITDTQMSHFKKIYSTDVSYKGGFNNSVEGTKPADYAIINSMNVDWYRQADYESMELKTFMPINKKNGMNAWALTKVLDQFGTERKINYYTVDFFDTLEEIYTMRSNTSKMNKSDVDANKKMDQIRSLLSSDIFKRIDYLDKK